MSQQFRGRRAELHIGSAVQIIEYKDRGYVFDFTSKEGNSTVVHLSREAVFAITALLARLDGDAWRPVEPDSAPPSA